MFDTYKTTLRCPIDDVELTEFQGKDGPCLLYTFREGRVDPLEADEGRRLAEVPEATYLADFSDDAASPPPWSERDSAALRRAMLVGAIGQALPPVFRFSALCGDHDVDCAGETDSAGTWVRSRVILVSQWFVGPGVAEVIDLPGREPVEILESESLELWRSGAFDAEAIARREELRAQKRSQLPKHGGNATCSNKVFVAHGKDEPATVWMGRFLCLTCAEHERDSRAWAQEAAVR